MLKQTGGHFFFGALFIASLSAVRCGGDDTVASDTAGSGPGGSSGSAGSTSGSAGTNAGKGGTGGASAGSGGAGGASAGSGGTADASGGAGGPADASTGAGGTAGAGGTSASDSGSTDGAVVEAGACSLLPPMEDSVCTMKQVCHYATADCACTKTPGAEAGRGWACSTFDAGSALVDAGTCPATLMDGEACTTKGQRCPVGDGGGQCVCLKNVWNCP